MSDIPTRATATERPNNGLGIAGFIVSIVGIFTCGALHFLSLPLSLIALLWKPRGFAIAGTVISLLGVGFFAAVGYGLVLGVTGFRKLADESGRRMTTADVASQAMNRLEQAEADLNGIPDGIDGNKRIIDLKDGWDTPLRYDTTDGSYLVRSAGPDKKYETEDDLTFERGERAVATELDIDFGGDGVPSDGPFIIPEDGTAPEVEFDVGNAEMEEDSVK